MPLTNLVTLQINLAPGDYLHALHILPHQLVTLSNQVNEIILTVDTKPGKGRFAANWRENKQHLDTFLISLQRKFNLKITYVDYSSHYKKAIGSYFFGNNSVPDKDFRGGPFYAYFFGLHHAKNELVLHLDSDIFLGGGSLAWVTEATEQFKKNSNCLIVSPLPGPPHKQDLLIGQNVISKTAPYTYELPGMSTRIFMINKSKFKTKKLNIQKPGFRNQLKSIIEGNSNAELPERIISDFMQKNKLKRVDFLGVEPGLWSLHPPYRTQQFYKDLPELIKRIEKSELPTSQYGFYDIVDELFDWSSAKEKLSQTHWWKRILK